MTKHFTLQRPGWCMPSTQHRIAPNFICAIVFPASCKHPLWLQAMTLMLSTKSFLVLHSKQHDSLATACNRHYLGTCLLSTRRINAYIFNDDAEGFSAHHPLGYPFIKFFIFPPSVRTSNHPLTLHDFSREPVTKVVLSRPTEKNSLVSPLSAYTKKSGLLTNGSQIFIQYPTSILVTFAHGMITSS